MAIPAKSKYVMARHPGARSGATLYCGRYDAPSLWARIVLAEKDVDNVRVEWVSSGEPHPDLLILNPTLSVPTLAERDNVIFPAAIIAEYLDERFPHPRLLPADPASRARARMLVTNLITELFPLLDQLDAATKAPDRNKLRKQLEGALKSAAGVLPQRGWCLGPDFGMADCLWGAILTRIFQMQLGELPVPAPLQRYAQQLLTRDSVKSVMR